MHRQNSLLEARSELSQAATGQYTMTSVLAVVRAPEVWREGTAANANRDHSAGSRAGRYRIVRELGRGGNAVCYLAYDRRLNREVTLKTPRLEIPLTDNLRRRFRREARLAGRLRHPNIATVFDAFQVDGRPWIAMERCDASLDALLLARGRLAPAEAARLVAQLADAIGFLHRRRLIHLDLKPSNVGVQLAPGLTCLRAAAAKLIDFGSVAHAGRAERDAAHYGGEGTLAYMPPERIRSSRCPPSAAADIYGLGLILFELLTGRPAISAGDRHHIIAQILTGVTVRTRVQGHLIAPALAAICRRALDVHPRRRHTSAQELAEELRLWPAGAGHVSTDVN